MSNLVAKLHELSALCDEVIALGWPVRAAKGFIPSFEDKSGKTYAKLWGYKKVGKEVGDRVKGARSEMADYLRKSRKQIKANNSKEGYISALKQNKARVDEGRAKPKRIGGQYSELL